MRRWERRWDRALPGGRRGSGCQTPAFLSEKGLLTTGAEAPSFLRLVSNITSDRVLRSWPSGAGKEPAGSCTNRLGPPGEGRQEGATGEKKSGFLFLFYTRATLRLPSETLMSSVENKEFWNFSGS